MNIYVGNLAFGVTEGDLKTAFAPYGQVSEARLITDRDTGRSKGFGFVEMASATEAQAAIAGLNGKDIQGRAVTVNEARPRDDSRSRSSGGGGRGRGPSW